MAGTSFSVSTFDTTNGQNHHGNDETWKQSDNSQVSPTMSKITAGPYAKENSEETKTHSPLPLKIVEKHQDDSLYHGLAPEPLRSQKLPPAHTPSSRNLLSELDSANEHRESWEQSEESDMEDGEDEDEDLELPELRLGMDLQAVPGELPPYSANADLDDDQTTTFGSNLGSHTLPTTLPNENEPETQHTAGESSERAAAETVDLEAQKGRPLRERKLVLIGCTLAWFAIPVIAMAGSFGLLTAHIRPFDANGDGNF